MAKIVRGKKIKKAPKDEVFPLEKINYIIIGVGLLFIIFGYIALSEKTVEGFFPLVVAPIFLVIGYCIIIPIGIMYQRKGQPKSQDTLRPLPDQFPPK